ncbi:MAG: hypothetical protein K2O88_01430 [Paramuribaculum sp.]|nr:hypothetical protein [Paramuribaculum sp.]
MDLATRSSDAESRGGSWAAGREGWYVGCLSPFSPAKILSRGRQAEDKKTGNRPLKLPVALTNMKEEEL